MTWRALGSSRRNATEAIAQLNLAAHNCTISANTAKNDPELRPLLGNLAALKGFNRYTPASP